MRVLLVNAYATSSGHGRQRYDEFRQHVVRVVKEIERQDVTQIDIVEKARHELDEFLFEMHSEYVEPSRITNFDRLDFVFVAGDPSACPWGPACRKLALLAKMCMMTGKCFYGSGIGAALLAFLCSTAGERVHVVNSNGKGSLINDVQKVPPPPPLSPSHTTIEQRASAAADVLLDTRSGDFFAFDRRAHAWVPRGNTGLMHHTSDHAHAYGAKVNTARAGAKSHRAELSHALVASKRGDTKCCARLEAATHAVFVGGNAIVSREFLVNCKSVWDLDEQINATGNNRYRVLLDSRRGPMLVEFSNCLGSHFVLSREYPESGKLLRNFVLVKYEEFKVHEHVDRSYVAAISGSARLIERLQLAATKTTAAAALASAREGGGNSSSSGCRTQYRPDSPVRATMITSGKTSPKRCRPVSAGPYRTAARAAEAVRTIQTSRSVYPSMTGSHLQASQAESPSSRESICSRLPSEMERLAGHGSSPPSGNNEQETRSHRPQTARASFVRVEKKAAQQEPEIESPATEEPATFHHITTTASPRGVDDATASYPKQKTPVKAHRRIRVAQKNELEKPYCAFDKFHAMQDAEKTQHHEPCYYSVVNDAPYMSAIDREQLEQLQGKLKWVAGPFRTAVGKSSTRVAPEVGVFTRTPFVDKNLPFHIIQRRQLEPPSPPPRREPARPRVDLHSHHEPTKARPASAAAASTRRPQR